MSWIQKGYHIESLDGRRHTALSEASCNGHADVVQFLIEQGADPNAANDTGRTPLVGTNTMHEVNLIIQLLLCLVALIL